MELRGEGGSILQQQEAITAQGVARVSFGLDQPGLLEIRVASDPALVSQVLQLDVGSGGQAAAVTVIVPELTESVEEASESTPVSEESDFVTRSGALRFSAWVATILLLLACCLAVGFAGWRAAGPDWGLRWGLAALAGGLLPYNYVALGLPGGPGLALRSGIGGIILLSAVGLLTGWFAAWIWWRQTTRRGAPAPKDARGRNQP
jgi:beta-N-acetylhexosaminidase